MSYGLKEYKALLEKNFNDYKNPMSVPCQMDPFSSQATAYRQAKMEAINYAIEMLPEITEPKIELNADELSRVIDALAESSYYEPNYDMVDSVREMLLSKVKE